MNFKTYAKRSILGFMMGSIFGCSHALDLTAPSVKKVVRGNSAFAVDLYRKEKSIPGNLFFSPYSISTALAMTYGGAREETAQEMAQVLHFDQPSSEFHPAFAGLNERLAAIASKKEVKLSVANSLWCEERYHLNDEFVKLNRRYYNAEVQTVDFAESEAVCGRINSWVARKTENRIKDLLSPELLSRWTGLVLCNAIYFKGKWFEEFDPRHTSPGPFFISPDHQIQTPMMGQTLKIRNLQQNAFDMFELPYQGGELSMVVILPKAVDGLAAIEDNLDAAKLEEWLAAMDASGKSKAVVRFPKFKVRWKLDLAADLSAMGMPLAFSTNADFSGMTGKRDLFISAVVHQAFVEVNEEGTEAAAATAVVMTRASAAEPLRVFQVDHPFLFLIRDNQTGAILFLGRIVDPSKANG